MSLDDPLRATFRNYSTLFLVVFVVLMPLHLIYGWVFQDVFTVRELHGAIAEFPPARQVRGVGQSDIERARLWFWIIVALEVALLPLIVKAGRAVLDQDERGEVTTVTGAWSSIRGGQSLRTLRLPVMNLLGAAWIALIVAVLAETALRAFAGFVPDYLAFLALAFASAAGRSSGIPFLTVAFASDPTGDSRAPEKVPDLY